MMKADPRAVQIYEALRKDMGLFGKMVAPQAYTAPTPEFHKEIYAHLMNDNIKRLVIAAPRGHSKTLLATKINVLYHILYKPVDYVLPIVLISESEAQAIDYLYDIKIMLEESELINTVYAQIWGFNFGEAYAKKWTETRVILPNHVKIMARGTGQKMRGCNYRNVRPRLIILDDFESEHNTDSLEAVTKNRNWLTNTVIPSLNDDGRIIIIGNMVADRCCLAWLKTNPAWKTLWYQAIDDAWEKPLWPERFSVERLRNIRKYDYEEMGNPFGFWREYMNIAVPLDARSITPEDLKYWDDNDGYFDWIDEIPCLIFKNADGSKDIRPCFLFMGIDPAPGHRKESGDFYVRTVIAIDAAGRVYVLEYNRSRIEVNQQAKDIVDTFVNYRKQIARTTIETVGYQESLRSVTRDLMEERSLYIPGLEKGVNPRTEKSSRHDRIVGLAKTGKLYVKRSMDALISELLSVHNTQHSPDCLDSLWNALYNSYPYYGEQIEETPKPKAKDELDEEDHSEDWLIM